MDIDRCNGVRCNNQSCQYQGRLRTITCRFNNFKDKEQILNNAKKSRDTGIYIYKDFSRQQKFAKKSLGESTAISNAK